LNSLFKEPKFCT